MNDEQELRKENDVYEISTQVTATGNYSYISVGHSKKIALGCQSFWHSMCKAVNEEFDTCRQRILCIFWDIMPHSLF
jgi:hypothetical protein